MEKKNSFLFQINKWWLEACYVLIFRGKTNEHHAHTQQKAAFLRELFPPQGAEFKPGEWKPIKWSFFLKENVSLLLFICILVFVSVPFQQIKVVAPNNATRKWTLLTFPFFKERVSSTGKELCIVINVRSSVEILINCFMLFTSLLFLLFFFLNTCFFSLT